MVGVRFLFERRDGMKERKKSPKKRAGALRMVLAANDGSR
ncbi:hypothetical protein STZ1_20326 [Bacillus subtilis]